MKLRSTFDILSPLIGALSAVGLCIGAAVSRLDLLYGSTALLAVASVGNLILARFRAPQVSVPVPESTRNTLVAHR